MRGLLIVFLILVVSLAGCVDNDEPAPSQDPTDSSVADGLDQKPSRRFEPELILEAATLDLEKGDIIDLEYYVTDLDDYELPRNFIDWTLTYNREANPVDEGDANELPGSYSRNLYADGYHNFTFSVDDGQGFSSKVVLSLVVGEIPIAPVEGAILPMDPWEGTGTAVGVCPLCFLDYGDACMALEAGVSGTDCVFWEIPVESPGHIATIEGGSLADPDWIGYSFYDSCEEGTLIEGTSPSYGPFEVVVPPGSACLVVYNDQTAPTDFIASIV